MNQVNIRIRLNPQQLNFPLPTMYARQLHSFVAAVENIPDDVTAVYVSVFTPGGTRYDVPVARRPNSAAGVAYLLPTLFPAVGSAKYEVRASDSSGFETALGSGAVDVAAFSTPMTPTPPDVPVLIQQIPDAQGRLHSIRAVPDGEGGYTTIVED